MKKKQEGRWKQVEFAKMRRLMKEGDKKFSGRRGKPYWSWVADQMGRTAKACRSKDVHMRAAVNGVVEDRRKKPAATEPLSKIIGDLVLVLDAFREQLAAVAKRINAQGSN